MLKKLIILLSLFAIENSINCAVAENVIGINYITKVSDEDLAQIAPNDACAICQDLFGDRSNLYKSNCPQMLTHPHIFHRDCILGWIRSRQPLTPSCPVCRGQMINSNANLIEASENGHLEIVRLLLDRGTDINARDNDGFTALMFASENGYLEIARLLIGIGADINARSNLGSTALMLAIWNGHLEIVSGHLEIVRLLLDRDADINSRNNFGFTALTLALHKGHQEIADLLVARGAIE